MWVCMKWNCFDKYITQEQIISTVPGENSWDAYNCWLFFVKSRIIPIYVDQENFGLKLKDKYPFNQPSSSISIC